jgi:hypothetical protein
VELTGGLYFLFPPTTFPRMHSSKKELNFLQEKALFHFHTPLSMNYIISASAMKTEEEH